MKIGDLAAWAAIVVTVIVAAFVQSNQNSNANKIANRGIQATRQEAVNAGIATAEVYLARVRLEQKGLIDMWGRGVTLQSYESLADFDIDTSDGVALQAAGAPAVTIGRFGSLSGWLQNTYTVLLKNGGRTPLSGGAYKLICGALDLADAAQQGLRRIPAVQMSAQPEIHLPDPNYIFRTRDRQRRVTVHHAQCLYAGHPA